MPEEHHSDMSIYTSLSKMYAGNYLFGFSWVTGAVDFVGSVPEFR